MKFFILPGTELGRFMELMSLPARTRVGTTQKRTLSATFILADSTNFEDGCRISRRYV